MKLTKNEFRKFSVLRGCEPKYSGKQKRFFLRKLVLIKDLHGLINDLTPRPTGIGRTDREKRLKDLDAIKQELDCLLLRFNVHSNISCEYEVQKTKLFQTDKGVFYEVNTAAFAKEFYRHINSSVCTTISFCAINGKYLQVWV